MTSPKTSVAPSPPPFLPMARLFEGTDLEILHRGDF
jgi:hypothetical protein